MTAVVGGITAPLATGRDGWLGLLRRIPPRILWPGVIGAAMLAAGGLGAGAIVRRDPLLSGTFMNAIRYGHGHDLAFMVLFVGLFLMVLSWVRLGRLVRVGTVGGRTVALAAAAWTTPLIIAPPLYSRDVYSYLAQGAVALRGFDPYAEGASVLDLPLRGNVAGLWQETPSPYGPLFLLLGKGTVFLTGDNVILGAILMRIAVLGGLALLVLAIPGLTRHLGGRAPVAMWLTVANPLVLALGIGGAHNDILMVGLMALGVVKVLDRKHLSGFALIALATAVKATAFLVVPFLVWVWAARLSGPARHRFLVATAAGGAAFIVVFTAATMVAGVDLGWIGVLKSQGPLLTWMSLPCAAAEILFYTLGRHIPGWTHDGFLGFFRAAGMVVLLGVLVRQWWLAREGGVDAVRRATIALLAASLLAPSVLPWYFTWALALAAAFAWSDRWIATLAGVSVWMVLVTLPDGTIVARWTYGDMNGWVWWPYLAATVAAGVWVGKSLLKPEAPPDLEPVVDGVTVTDVIHAPEPAPKAAAVPEPTRVVGGTGG
ncbi:polyprenol phosphomannose-dependent alpha 1,6 mannosyltransferase MptB [Lentzea alba]|uniref:polyprenol phosphomannose-dependent alpha 1,6 mannosyltransferase MptB n=1 Tax=Lentzea alba TaxID=2714351 RepID=UPI0039BF988F